MSVYIITKVATKTKTVFISIIMIINNSPIKWVYLYSFTVQEILCTLETKVYLVILVWPKLRCKYREFCYKKKTVSWFNSKIFKPFKTLWAVGFVMELGPHSTW